ncbi:MAG: MFS transporter, partial [Acidobacteria bacterium]|nr:MFS transporter [Acidobacteriota bacterium]
TVTGIVLAASAVSFFLTTFAAGFLIETIRPGPLLVGGLLLGAVSISLFARWPSPGLNILLNLAVGIYMGIVEVITNYEAIRMETGGKSRLMNLLHAGFSLGAIVGPLVVGSILRAGGSWKAIYPASGALLLVMACLFVAFPFPDYEKRTERKASRGLGLAKEPLLLLFTAVIILYVGSELGVTNWASEYFVRILGAPASTAAFAVSALWIGLLAGRSLLSLAYHGTRQEIVLLVLSLVCAGCLLGFLAVSGSAAGLAIVIVLGMGYSGIYPLIMTLTGRAFKSSAAVGIVTTGAGLGSFSFPFLLAGIAERLGLRTGFLMLAVLPLGIAVIAVILIRRLPRNDRT